MKITKILIFDIFGDYAHFRRGYTTTSALTYPFPPKSTLIGIIAGIIGLPNERESNKNYYALLRDTLVSLRILNPIKKVMIKENFIDTKHGFTPWEIQRKKQQPRTQIPLEFLKEPSYRIYVRINNSYLEKLREFIKYHKSFYTTYLGITECLANFKFVGYFEEKEITQIKPNDEGLYEIDSIIPSPAVNENLKIEENIPYGITKVPLFINERRETESYCEFIFNEDGNPLNKRAPLKTINILENYKDYAVSVGGENVIFF